jgi:hypothetical protein
MAATLAVVYGGMQVAAVMPADAPVVIGLAAAAALRAVLCIIWLVSGKVPAAGSGSSRLGAAS